MSDVIHVPEAARAALRDGRIGEALRLVRPVALELWGRAELPDEFSDFIEACYHADCDVLAAS